MEFAKSLACAIVLILSLASIGLACDCLTLNEAESFETATAVFIGRVVEVHTEGSKTAYVLKVERSFKGGESGPAIVPGEPKKSLLIKAIGYEDPELKMPRNGKLAETEIADLTEWVQRGAPWPDDGGGKTVVKKEFDLKERAKHWSLQPLTHAGPPSVKNPAWVKSPIGGSADASSEWKAKREGARSLAGDDYHRPI